MSQYIDFKSNEVLLTWVEKIYFIGKVSYLLRQNKYISCDKKSKSDILMRLPFIVFQEFV